MVMSKRKFIPGSMGNLPSARRSQAKRLRTLEKKVASNKTEVEILSGLTDRVLESTSVGGSWSGIMNPTPDDSVSGRNYKTVHVSAKLASEELSAGPALYKYRMILFSNKNDSSFENTASGSGALSAMDFPKPYGEATVTANTPLSLNFNIDYKRFTVYADRTHQLDSTGNSTYNTQSTLGPLMVSTTFSTPKLVRLSEDNGAVTHGAIGLAIYRQDLSTGETEFLSASTPPVGPVPNFVVQHKWIDP